MLRHRFLYGGLFLVVLLAVALWEISRQGRLFLSAFLTLVALAALHDYFDMMKRGGRTVLPVVGLGAAALLFLLKAGLFGPRSGLEEVLVLVALLVASVFAGARLDARARYEGIALTLFGFCYVALPGSFFLDLVSIPGEPGGGRLFLWTVITVKAGDIGCYFAGTWFGRRRLSSISPNKTWEGSAGGALFGMAVAAALVPILLGEPVGAVPAYLLVAGVLQGVGQIGDLVESAIKRGVEVKDSGRWLPGIGGVLDTADSLVLAAPVAVALHRLLLA
jgi:phosphatidate cytidylyltransferase